MKVFRHLGDTRPLRKPTFWSPTTPASPFEISPKRRVRSIKRRVDDPLYNDVAESYV
jgi:hypothetical protein